MKNQYVGDIGDYGKYGLLRFLGLHGITVGINWYLTGRDETGNGAITGYLNSPGQKECDPVVFSALERIVKTYSQDERRVQMIQDENLIPAAIYYSDEVNLQDKNPKDRVYLRRFWYNRSIIALKNAELIFADPDNGISYHETSRSKKGEKYVFPEEIAGYYYRGKDVVFYCHKGRRNEDKWRQAVVSIAVFIPEAKVYDLAFYGGPRRSYIFVVHPENAERYRELLNEFVTGPWKKRFPYHAIAYSDCEGGSQKEQLEINRRIVERFQKMYPSQKMKEAALSEMTNPQIDNLINASFMEQEKTFYASFRKTDDEMKRLDDVLILGSGFMAPTIGEIYV